MDNMPGCRPGVVKAKYLSEKLAEMTTRFQLQLTMVDDCLRTYRATIDKKMFEQTPREALKIKTCQSADLYPPAIRKVE